LRLLIKWLLVFITIGGILGVLATPPDAFPSPDFTQRVHSIWIGRIAALVAFALGMMLWASKVCRAPNSNAPLISQAIAGSLVASVLNGVTYLGATSSIGGWIARSTANADAIYLTTVKHQYSKTCANDVEWYEPTLERDVSFCTNLAIFTENDRRTSREAIAHVLRGPSGIRIVTIRALDTELGQEDLVAMRSAARAADNQ
jgi:hypothetical protein